VPKISDKSNASVEVKEAEPVELCPYEIEHDEPIVDDQEWLLSSYGFMSPEKGTLHSYHSHLTKIK
jgi:hypothetical protein